MNFKEGEIMVNKLVFNQLKGDLYQDLLSPPKREPSLALFHPYPYRPSRRLSMGQEELKRENSPSRGGQQELSSEHLRRVLPLTSDKNLGV